MSEKLTAASSAVMPGDRLDKVGSGPNGKRPRSGSERGEIMPKHERAVKLNTESTPGVPDSTRYVIRRVENSVDWEIGQQLSKTQVQELIRLGIKVTIV